MIKTSLKGASKRSYSSKVVKTQKVDSGFYGANDLKPKLTKRINSTGGYTSA